MYMCFVSLRALYVYFVSAERSSAFSIIMLFQFWFYYAHQAFIDASSFMANELEVMKQQYMYI